MPRVPTVFFLSIYGLTAIAGLMLAFAEGNPFPEILTPALAIVAYVLTDRTRKVHLPLMWANILGVLVFLYAASQMFGTTVEVRLLAGAHLVVYLTWIVLFQEKHLAQYWWMCALSVLQAAIGSILTISSSYGGMLLGFMFASIWTLSVFSLYRAHLQYGQAGETQSAAGTGLTNRLRRGTWMGGRAGQNAARAFLNAPSTARGTMQLDPDERWLGARFALSMVAVSGAAMIVGAAFFLFIPRLWAGRSEWGADESKQFRAAAITGFTTEVRLGDLVPLLENPKRVLTVSLFDVDGTPLDLERYCAKLGYAEPLFRGATMESYEDGTWAGSGRGPTLDTLPPAPVGDSVREQFLLEPLGTPMLFAIEPFDAVRLPNPREQVEWQKISGQIFRPDTVPIDKAVSYDVYSPAEASIRPRPHWVRPNDEFASDYFLQYRKLPPRLPQLTALARKLTGFQLGKPRPIGEARTALSRGYVEILLRHLRDSGIYRYSLDTSSRDPKLDPIEDFIANRKTGHCEYFASALALMLRAVAIPSRLVSGFKGGAVNGISGTYEVEQRHAHVWVEAFIEGRPGTGYWMVVDPTPAARDDSVRSFASPIGAAHDLASVVSSTWSRLIAIDINAQESSFYDPMVTGFKNWWNPTKGNRPFLAQLVAGVIDFLTDPTQWFTVTGILMAALFSAGVAGIVVLIRLRKRIWQRLRALWKPRRTDRQIRIAFYERFEALCRQLGLVRPGSQTQREFAATVGPRIRQVVQSPDGLPQLPPRLVEFFYRARFGNEELPAPTIEELNRDMTQLEQALKKPRRR